MGKPVSEIPSYGSGFMIKFIPHGMEEQLDGQLLHIVGGGDLREPVALVLATSNGHKGKLYSVGISRLVGKTVP